MVPSAVGPMVKTALAILAIELFVIGWVRWRYALAPMGNSAASRRNRQLRVLEIVNTSAASERSEVSHATGASRR